MPIKPKAEETEQEFISRCMSVEKDSLPEQDQRLAVCYSYWDKREEMETEDITDTTDELETEVSQGFAYATKESEDFATLPTTDCMERHQSAGYTEQYAKQACYGPKKNDAQQGGVVAMNEEFGRKKFEYSPNAKETLGEFMGRCMSDEMVREKKKDRPGRAAFCYSQYQNKYISNIAMRWK
jgi:hypothetical protein